MNGRAATAPRRERSAAILIARRRSGDGIELLAGHAFHPDDPLLPVAIPIVTDRRRGEERS
jgi:hypothetical protein